MPRKNMYAQLLYKTVFQREAMDRVLSEELVKWLTKVLDDPIVKALLPRTTLTKPQLETLVIYHAEMLENKSIEFKKNIRLALMKLRGEKASLSKGAFVRTLQQARRNVLRAVATIVLLSYLGLLDPDTLIRARGVGVTLREVMEEMEAVEEQDPDEMRQRLSTIIQRLLRIV